MDEIKEQPKVENVPGGGNLNVPSKKITSDLGWVVSILLFILVAFLSVYSFQLMKKNKELVFSKEELANYKKNIDEEKKMQEAVVSKGNDLFKILIPKGGEVFCLEQPNDISWNVPPEVQTVVASLDTSVSFNRIGEFPAIFSVESGVGKGTVSWNMKNEPGFYVPEGNVYKISLTADYNGKQIRTVSDGIFSVKRCQPSTCSKENSCKARTSGSEFRCDAQADYNENGMFLCMCNNDCEVVKK